MAKLIKLNSHNLYSICVLQYVKDINTQSESSKESSLSLEERDGESFVAVNLEVGIEGVQLECWTPKWHLSGSKERSCSWFSHLDA